MMGPSTRRTAPSGIQSDERVVPAAAEEQCVHVHARELAPSLFQPFVRAR